jgi:hypothetical protein
MSLSLATLLFSPVSLSYVVGALTASVVGALNIRGPAKLMKLASLSKKKLKKEHPLSKKENDVYTFRKRRNEKNDKIQLLPPYQNTCRH